MKKFFITLIVFLAIATTSFAQFTDIYGKFSTQSSNGSKISAYGFNFNDAVNISATQAINWDSWGVGLDFTVVPPSSSTLIEGAFATSSYYIESTEIPNTCALALL